MHQQVDGGAVQVAGIEFGLLGPVEILQDGQRKGPTTAQQRCVLAMLLLDLGRVVSTGRLVSALWDASPPASARNSVRVHVTKLRKLLAADPTVEIVTVGEGWRLACDRERVDLYRFRDLVRAGGEGAEETGRLLREALSLWRGPALADAAGDRLVRAVAEGLEDERLAAVEDRIAWDLRSGADRGAVSELSVLVAEHPLRERPAGLLMSALRRGGRVAEGLEVFHRMRKRLVEELGIEPSAALRNEYQRLLRTADEGEDPPGEAPLPRQLPGDVAVFAGRAAHLSHLDGLLDRATRAGTMLVATVAGIPGSGKTTLAVHWAHRVRDRFPDGQLYVNLRGFDASGDAVDPAEAVLQFLGALGVPAAAIPADTDARSAMYRSLLADRRMLVVLDNARDEAQVRELIPGSAGCCVLVTGRTELAGLVARGAHPLALDVFDPAESRDLLMRRLGPARVRREPEAAAQIIERCAGLPLSLTMVAARAAVQPDFALASLAAELESSEVVLDAFESPDATIDLRTVFSWSYLRLSTEAAQLFRLLGLHWGPDFGAGAAASLAGVPVPAVMRWLRELCRMQLVAEHAPGRFDLHDLLAAYAAELAEAIDDPQTRWEATRRVLDHYLHTADAAARLLAPHRRPIRIDEPVAATVVDAPEGKDGALAWFDAERPALVRSLHSAPDGAHRPMADRYRWQLAWFLSTHQRRMGLGAEWIATQRLAVSAAHRTGDTLAKAVAHHGLAAAHVRFGDHEEAESHLRAALRHFEELGDRGGQANVHAELCLIAEAAQDYAAAFASAQRSLDMYREDGNEHGQVRALNNIGYIHAANGEHARALEAIRHALRISREIGDADGEATILDSLGFTYTGLGEYDRAIDCYRKAAALLHQCGERVRAASALDRLGDAHLAAGDRAAASGVWRRALRVFDDLGHPKAETLRAKLIAMTTPRRRADGGGGRGGPTRPVTRS
jgi:pentatricopeptide repeat protein